MIKTKPTFCYMSKLTPTLSAEQTRSTDNVNDPRDEILNGILFSAFARAAHHHRDIGRGKYLEIIMIQRWILIYLYYYSFIQRVFQQFFLII
jgi:hypothetical protein